MVKEPEIAAFVCSTIALACNRDPASVSLDTSLQELNMDSLTLVSVLGQVEATYGVAFATEDMLVLIAASRVSEVVDKLEAILGRQ